MIFASVPKKTITTTQKPIRTQKQIFIGFVLKGHVTCPFVAVLAKMIFGGEWRNCFWAERSEDFFHKANLGSKLVLVGLLPLLEIAQAGVFEPLLRTGSIFRGRYRWSLQGYPVLRAGRCMYSACGSFLRREWHSWSRFYPSRYRVD